VTLVLIHSAGGNEFWDLLCRSRRVDVRTPVLPGRGSVRGDHPRTAARAQHGFRPYLRAEKIERAVIAGHSWWRHRLELAIFRDPIVSGLA